MYLAYCDESGQDGKSPVFIMVGVIADASRYGRTSAEFEALFAECSQLARAGLTELKASDLYAGNNKWRGVEAEERMSIFDKAISIAAERKHSIALAAIENDVENWPSFPSDMPTGVWALGGLHIALQIQRAHTAKKANKGSTLLVFDDSGKAPELTELLLDPPKLTDEYYNYQRGSRLSSIIDTAVTVKSHHFGMVQLADIYAFVFRHFLEVSRGAEAYPGELGVLQSWADQLGERLLKRAHRWPRSNFGEVAAWYNGTAPPELEAYSGR